MKKITLILFYFLSLAVVSAKPARMELNRNWTFKQVRGVNTYPATAPGVVHLDLMAAGIIADPFVGMNERACQWVDKEDWVYQTVFDVPDDIFSKNNIRMLFKGLDTYADVYINDSLVLKADNMFCEWDVDCKKILKARGNSLRIYFHSPVKVDLPKLEALPYRYEAGNDQSENGGLLDRRVSIFARKAGYHYGWDWGPRLVTSGIWRPVYLEGWNDARIDDLWIRAKNVSEKSAQVFADVEITADRSMPAEITLVNDLTKEVYVSSTPVALNKGSNTVKLSFNMKNPNLWWTNGLGEQYLYTFKALVSSGNITVDEQVRKAGIRSLRLVRSPDTAGDGVSFYFELNGAPVFMKGANYIPCDNFLPRVTDSRYEQVILDARNTNMNMLRVWGGGIYENDVFYELCDKYGIMVWQDFMFACSMYPADIDMQRKIKLEAEQNVRRLRSHPCMALWCGNNEINDAWYNWGWKRDYEKQSKDIADRIWNEYQTIFHKILPEAVAAYDPDLAYWASSPMREPGAEGTRENQRAGDLHYWGVWHAEAPIHDYAKVIPRFMSEYGFQSFPELGSVAKYVPNRKDWDIFSDVMLAHQRNPRGNQLIKSYMEANYKMPSDFETFLYVSQLLQADALKIGEEAHRRNMPYCMGSLYWQHNDCWPVASWSSTDYYGRWKALHYFSRRAFAPVLVSPFETGDALTVHLVSDRRKPFKGKLSVQLCDFAGNPLFEKTQTLTVKPNTSAKVFEQATASLLKGKSRSEVFVYVVLYEDDKAVAENTYYLALQKDMNFPEVKITRAVSKTDGGYNVTLSSDRLARAVYLSLNDTENFFDDNYFDLIPGKPVTVKVTSKLPQNEFENRLKITTYN